MKRQKFTGSRKHLLLRQSISNDGKTQGGRGVRQGFFKVPKRRQKELFLLDAGNKSTPRKSEIAPMKNIIQSLLATKSEAVAMEEIHPHSFYRSLEQLPDGRKAQGRHYPLPLLLTVICLAKLGGGRASRRGRTVPKRAFVGVLRVSQWSSSGSTFDRFQRE